MMHPELPIRPEHSESCSGCEIIQHPSGGTGNLSNDRFGTISIDNIFLAYKVVLRKHLPIRPAHGDGPRSNVGRFNNERTEYEFGVPERTSPFLLTPEKSIITLRSLRIVPGDVNDAATGYQTVLRRAWSFGLIKRAELAIANLHTLLSALMRGA